MNNLVRRGLGGLRGQVALQLDAKVARSLAVSEEGRDRRARRPAVFRIVL